MRLPFRQDEKIRLAVFLIATLWLSFFYNLGGVPLFDRDEGAFSEATREMFARRDFISTYLNGEPRYDKPILIYWCQAVSVLILGLNEFALRFPSAIFAAFWTISVYLFWLRYLDKITALSAFAMMATSLWVVIIGRAAIADALFNLMVALVLFNIFHFFNAHDKKYVYSSFLWAALGFLTKGPVILIISAAVSLIFFGIQKRWKEWRELAFNVTGGMIFLVVAAPWYIIQYGKEGRAFIDGFFFKHNVNRYLSVMEGHGGLLFYYLPILVLILLPYSTLLISMIASQFRELFKHELDTFLWVWFLFVLVFFSLAGTKLPHYILHGATPLFILMARYRNSITSRVWMLMPAGVFILIIFFLPEISNMARMYGNDADLHAALSDSSAVFTIWYRIWASAALTAIILLLIFYKKEAWKAAICSGYVMVILIIHTVLPAVGQVQQVPVVKAAHFAKEHDLDLVMWGVDNPSFSLYRGEVTSLREPAPGDIVFTRSSRLKHFFRFDILFQEGGFVIARIMEK